MKKIILKKKPIIENIEEDLYKENLQVFLDTKDNKGSKYDFMLSYLAS